MPSFIKQASLLYFLALPGNSLLGMEHAPVYDLCLELLLSVLHNQTIPALLLVNKRFNTIITTQKNERKAAFLEKVNPMNPVSKIVFNPWCTACGFLTISDGGSNKEKNLNLCILPIIDDTDNYAFYIKVALPIIIPNNGDIIEAFNASYLVATHNAYQNTWRPKQVEEPYFKDPNTLCLKIYSLNYFLRPDNRNNKYIEMDSNGNLTIKKCLKWVRGMAKPLNTVI